MTISYLAVLNKNPPKHKWRRKHLRAASATLCLQCLILVTRLVLRIATKQAPARSRQEGQVTVKSTRSLQRQQLRSVGGDISLI